MLVVRTDRGQAQGLAASPAKLASDYVAVLTDPRGNATTFTLDEVDEERASAGVVELWRVANAKTADILVISIHEILHDSSHELGVDPGLQKDGVEADLQVFEGMSHAQYNFDPDAPETKETFTEIARFFDRHLGK